MGVVDSDSCFDQPMSETEWREPELLFTIGTTAKGYARADYLMVFCDAFNLQPVSLAAITEQAELYGYAQLAESDEDSLIFVPKQ